LLVQHSYQPGTAEHAADPEITSLKGAHPDQLVVYTFEAVLLIAHLLKHYLPIGKTKRTRNKVIYYAMGS
jgi:hypothetical protein